MAKKNSKTENKHFIFSGSGGIFGFEKFWYVLFKKIISSGNPFMDSSGVFFLSLMPLKTSFPVFSLFSNTKRLQFYTLPKLFFLAN